MIVSLIAGVFELVRRPASLLPALVAALVNAGAYFLALEPLYSLLAEIGPGGTLPQAGVLQLPYLLLLRFPFELGVAALLALFSVASAAWLLMAYTYLHRKEKPLGTLRAMAAAAKDAPKILALAGVVLALGFLFGFLALVLGLVLKPVGEAGALFVLVWLLLGYYLYLKLLFAPVALAGEGAKIKDAFKASWKFTRGKIPALLVLTLVLSLAAYLAGNLGNALSGFIEDDVASTLVLAVFVALGSAYANTVLGKCLVIGQAK